MKEDKDTFEGMEEIVEALSKAGGEEREQDLSAGAIDRTRQRVAALMNEEPAAQPAWWQPRAVALYAAAIVLVIAGAWVLFSPRATDEIVEAPVESVELAIRHLQARMAHDIRVIAERHAPGNSVPGVLDRSGRLSRQIAMRSIGVQHELAWAGAISKDESF